jgi:hypothetical protein
MIDIPDGNLGNGLYMTYSISVTEWNHGEVKERIVIPAGEQTDYSSIPNKGISGWIAKELGLEKSKSYFTRSGKIHDQLYFALKYLNGILPAGWYQFLNPITNEWEPVISYRWDRQQADSIWRRISIEDGCPPQIAERGYRFLRVFGGLHMKLN